MKSGKTLLFIFSFLVCLFGSYCFLYADGFTANISGGAISWGTPQYSEYTDQSIGLDPVEYSGHWLGAGQYDIVSGGGGWIGSYWAAAGLQQSFTTTGGDFTLSGQLGGWLYVGVYPVGWLNGSGTSSVTAYVEILDSSSHSISKLSFSDSLSLSSNYCCYQSQTKNVSQSYNSPIFTLSDGSYYFHQYLETYISGGGNGAQGTASVFVPEPISSILFITGGILLAGRRYIRRKA